VTTARLPLVVSLLVAGIPQDSTKAFDVSSESSLYDVRGRFVGTFRVEPSQITIVVKSGSVLATRADPRVEIRAIIAGPSRGSWRKVGSSEPQLLGGFGAGERREVTDSLVFRISTPSGFDAQQHWLVFQFGRSDGSTTYACSDRNLAGPDSLSAQRAQQLRTFYPMAC
jgi:hypothetical protein